MKEDVGSVDSAALRTARISQSRDLGLPKTRVLIAEDTMVSTQSRFRAVYGGRRCHEPDPECQPKRIPAGHALHRSLALGVHLTPDHAGGSRDRESADRAVFHPDVFVGIERDGTVYIAAHRSEMGNGSRRVLPRIVADELDADRNRVRIIQAVGDPGYGSQDTDASRPIREFFDVMREAGATARVMLIRAAANKWSVPAPECESALHVVIHLPTGRKSGYGELALVASRQPVPRKEELPFKPQAAWSHICKDASLYDLEDICTGKAVYGMDAYVEGMPYASVERPPVLGARFKSCQDDEALLVPGVRRTVVMKPFKPQHAYQPLGGVAVIADGTWAAFQGRKKLSVVWDQGPNAAYKFDRFRKELQETASHPRKVVRNDGDVDAEFATNENTFEAEYYVPHLAHATMETPVALTDFEDGKVTQNPQNVQEVVAQAVGIRREDVTCHVTLLGGGFGRKSFPDFGGLEELDPKRPHSLGASFWRLWPYRSARQHWILNSTTLPADSQRLGQKGQSPVAGVSGGSLS
jgi:isoquinoline 1-oxidoreductase beta subunit